MTSMQFFGKHTVDYVTIVPNEKKEVCVSVKHFDKVPDIGTDAYTSFFFDSINEAAQFALEMLTKIINEMKEETT
jgi:hypothetical protein